MRANKFCKQFWYEFDGGSSILDFLFISNHSKKEFLETDREKRPEGLREKRVNMGKVSTTKLWNYLKK